MDDGDLDENEENQIEQQIEEDEEPAIQEIRLEINGDKFIIDRNGKKIKLYDPEDEEKKKRYDENRENEIKQVKEYYKENKTKVLEYKFDYYYKNNYDLSSDIIHILYGIKENNNIKKFKNINYYITIAELYNIEKN